MLTFSAADNAALPHPAPQPADDWSFRRLRSDALRYRHAAHVFGLVSRPNEITFSPFSAQASALCCGEATCQPLRGNCIDARAKIVDSSASCLPSRNHGIEHRSISSGLIRKQSVLFS